MIGGQAIVRDCMTKNLLQNYKYFFCTIALPVEEYLTERLCKSKYNCVTATVQHINTKKINNKKIHLPKLLFQTVPTKPYQIYLNDTINK